MAVPKPTARDGVGESLCEAEFITQEQLDQARAIAQASSPPLKLLDALVSIGALTQNQREELVELEFETPYVDLKHYLLDPDVVRLLPRELALRHKAVPIDRDGSALTVAMVDPYAIDAIDGIQRMIGLKIRPVAASLESVEYAIAAFAGDDDGEEDLVHSLQKLTFPQHYEDEADRLRQLVELRPVVATGNRMLIQAIRNRASDLHLCPQEGHLALRHRIDGVLRDIEFLPLDVLPALVSRIKVLADLDITEKRTPQDGRIEASVGQSTFDLRVSIVPSYYGEKVVIRILARQNALALDQLGFSDADLELVHSLLGQAHGVVVATGPTGSGKTATLHAALSHVNTRQISVITIEDPIEYLLHGATQINVQPNIGLTFAQILRSVLRQDPDIIMVGEVRDEETAVLAIRAALTGHLVLTTTHTNDAFGAATRLRNLGVAPHLLASSLRGVIAQRLLRTICPDCRETYKPSGPEIDMLRGERPRKGTLSRGAGCDECLRTGYRGRTAVFEVLPVTPTTSELIACDASETELRATANVPSLRDSAIKKVLAGITTVDEIRRVIGVSMEGQQTTPRPVLAAAPGGPHLPK